MFHPSIFQAAPGKVAGDAWQGAEDRSDEDNHDEAAEEKDEECVSKNNQLQEVTQIVF